MAFNFEGALENTLGDIRRKREFEDRMAERRSESAYRDKQIAVQERGNKLKALEIGLTDDVEEGLELKGDFAGMPPEHRKDPRFLTSRRQYQMAQADEFTKRLSERRNPRGGSSPDNLSEMMTLYRTLEDKRRNDPVNWNDQDRDLLAETEASIRRLSGMKGYSGKPTPKVEPKKESGLMEQIKGGARAAGDFWNSLTGSGGAIQAAAAAELQRRKGGKP
jgi:hypothetical protein